MNNIKLFVSSDPSAPYEHTATALTVRQARGLRMSDVEIGWEQPSASELAEWSVPGAGERCHSRPRGGACGSGIKIAAYRFQRS